MNIIEFEIKSLNDFLNQIDKYSHRKIHEEEIIRIYRGHSEIMWPLLPKIARNIKFNDDFLNNEKSLVEEFERIAFPYIDNYDVLNEYDILSIARHHGLPTRLLDWSTNPLVALYFACIEEKNNENDRCVWGYVLEKGDLIEDFIIKPYNLDRTKAFVPAHLTKRITAQNCWFTVHRYIHEEKRFIPLEKNKRESPKLVKFVIKNNLCKSILESLELLGVNRYSLIPDLDGLCEYLTWKKFKNI